MTNGRESKGIDTLFKKYLQNMNTAWPKKTNVTNFTTAQHSLRCRFLGRTQQVLNSTLFFYADTTVTKIQHYELQKGINTM